MAKFVHVARILPGQTEAFLANVKNGFEMGGAGAEGAGADSNHFVSHAGSGLGRGRAARHDIRGRGRVCDRGAVQQPGGDRGGGAQPRDAGDAAQSRCGADEHAVPGVGPWLEGRGLRVEEPPRSPAGQV
jgi:hypothetical protein